MFLLPFLSGASMVATGSAATSEDVSRTREAKAWRQEMQVAVRQGRARAPSTVTLAEAAREWLGLAEQGVVRTRSGDRYKPSTLRSYEWALRTPMAELGHMRLSGITRNDLQDLIDRLIAEGLSPSTIRNTLMPLRGIYRRSVNREQVLANPTQRLALPAVRARRDRVARPEEAAALIAAAPRRDQAIWATALYAGLRLGELRALDWENVDFDAGLIRVEYAWDRKAGMIEPKSRSGKRRVPLSRILRRHLLSHRLQQGHGGHGLAFGTALDPSMWRRYASGRTKLGRRPDSPPIRLHECRHTYAAYMIAAGINTKALSTYMGHATITITLDRYGHLLPGNETQAANLLDTWLERTSPLSAASQRFPKPRAHVRFLRPGRFKAAWWHCRRNERARPCPCALPRLPFPETSHLQSAQTVAQPRATSRKAAARRDLSPHHACLGTAHQQRRDSRADDRARFHGPLYPLHIGHFSAVACLVSETGQWGFDSLHPHSRCAKIRAVSKPKPGRAARRTRDPRRRGGRLPPAPRR